MSNEEYQKKYEQLDEDRADIIAYLKRMVQKKENEITELKERLEGLQKVQDMSFQHNVSLFFPLLYNICYEKKGNELGRWSILESLKYAEGEEEVRIISVQ